MSGVVEVWCGQCPVSLKVWWKSGVVNFLYGGYPFLHMVWWMCGLDWWMSVWWMSFYINAAEMQFEFITYINPQDTGLSPALHLRKCAHGQL